MLPVATGRKGIFPIACSINVGFGVGLAECEIKAKAPKTKRRGTP